MTVYIAAASRSPIGKICGTLSSLSATEMGAQVARTMLAEHDVDPDAFDDVIIGQVLTAGAGQNPARQTALGAGLPTRVPAFTVNQVCGGGQRALHLAAQAIQCGDAALVLAGGQDSMTQAPHLLSMRMPGKLGNAVMRDSVLIDGLTDAFHQVHMGVTAERLASRFQITRDMQDAFALQSQSRTRAALDAGRFDAEIKPLTLVTRWGPQSVATDEQPMPDLTAEKLARLKPAFVDDGTVTPGNSSGLNDGAATLIVGNQAGLDRAGLVPLVRIAAYASAGVDPMDMGMGPAEASRLALKKAGWSVADLDLVELNEAFAAQALAVNRDIGWSPDIVNVNGGAIALGHPLAGSGARIVVTLMHEMLRRGARRGLATMCIGGGQGVAVCLER